VCAFFAALAAKTSNSGYDRGGISVSSGGLVPV
jgi:hypothetical protein